MWPVNRPQMDPRETFKICVSKIRQSNLKQRLNSLLPLLGSAADEYEKLATASELHLFSKAFMDGNSVAPDEMIETYKQRMAKKGAPGRPIYDAIKLLPENDRCPFCDHRNVSTLDHILPKSQYPVLAVTPDNLVASCSDCNKAKLDRTPKAAEDTVIHPYFDKISNEQWLRARVIEQTPAAVVFYVADVDTFSAVLNTRIKAQFQLLSLAELYSNQAARELVNIRQMLEHFFSIGGEDAVRKELEINWQSRRSVRLNSWQTAFYETLTNSEWFCSGGFSIDLN